MRRILIGVLSILVLVAFTAMAGMPVAKAADPENFGFETGDLTGWTVTEENDYVGVHGADQYAQPYWGSYMVMLGQPHTWTPDTPVGDEMPMDGEWSGEQPMGPNTVMQQFTVRSSHLLFAYNFFTHEEPDGPWDQASYIVRVVGSETPIAQMSMISADVPSDWVYGDGDTYRKTGWKVVDVDLRAYYGKKIEVVFSAGGTLDDEVPSWAYFDGKEPTPVTLTPPTVAFLDQLQGMLTSTSSVTFVPVSVTAGSSPQTTLTLSTEGQTLAVSTQQGQFGVPVTLDDGVYTLQGHLVDGNGLTSDASTHLIVDTHAPDVEVSGADTVVRSSSVDVAGTAHDAVSGVQSVLVNGTPTTLYVDGSFSSTVDLKKGKNYVDVQATDELGNNATTTYCYDYEPTTAINHSVTVTLLLSKKDINVDGSWQTGEAAPMLYKGKVFLPAKEVLQLAGGTFHYADGKATLSLNGRTITLGLGANGGTIQSGVYYAPLEVLRDQLGLDISWDTSSQTISFTYWP